MKDWQFNVLFFVGVGGAILLLLGPEFGLHISQNPTALTGVGSILAYILTQRKTLTKKRPRDRNSDSDDQDEGGEEDR